MKKIISIIVMSLLCCSCTINNKSEVVIKPDSDTVDYGCIYRAELYVPFNDSIAPSVFMIRDNDTFQLPIQNDRRYAVFQAVGRARGGDEYYSGFVEYTNIKGKNIIEPFSVLFHVRSRNCDSLPEFMQNL